VSMLSRFAHGPVSLRLGEHEVKRLGYSAMRLTCKEGWGEPGDAAAAHAVLRRAVEHGINLIETSWYYGPHVANRLIVEALHPYPSDLVIATKVGMRRLHDHGWIAALRPDELEDDLERDRRSLRLERLPLVHLRWSDQREVPFGEVLDVMIDAQRRGIVQHLGLAHVSVAQLEQALRKTSIVSVQNLFGSAAGLHPQAPEAVLAVCEARGIAFLPMFPLTMDAFAAASGALAAAAKRHLCTPVQLALAWLLARSPVMLPTPGTSKVVHLDENVASMRVVLDRSSLAELVPSAA